MATVRIPCWVAASTAGSTPFTSMATTIRPVTPWDTKFSMSLFCLAESLLALAICRSHPASSAASCAPSFICVKKAAVWLIWVMPITHSSAGSPAAPVAASSLPVLHAVSVSAAAVAQAAVLKGRVMGSSLRRKSITEIGCDCRHGRPA